MPNSVENKAVSMTFDNGAFEKNVATTLTTLDKLKAALSFSSSKNDFSSITASANKVDLTGMAASVENISSKFSAMGAIAFTVLQSITMKALETAAGVFSAFSIAPTASGFSEYEDKIGAIQTIMAGSGESLEVVNQKLKELNTYSDKTIYSFADMTSNISKFTNAGVSLDKSVAAIQGVANVAALSGANAEEASRAMYNFGQALSSGSVKLMDWKSIELANMATVEFKTQLLESAVAAGTLTKTSEGLYMTLGGTAVTATKGFNESLSEAWLTSEALTKTLGDYADETTEIGKKATKAATDVKTFSQMIDTLKESAGSGWAETSEIIVGNFDEAKWLFTGINNILGGMLGASAAARNEILTEWKELGGRSQVLIGLSNIFNSFMDFAGAIKDAFREIFPRKTGKELAELSERFREFTQKLKMGGNTLKAIKVTFMAFFSVFKIGFAIIKGVFSVFGTLINAIGKANKLIAGGGLVGFVTKLASGFVKFANAIANNGIPAFFDLISTGVAKAIEGITAFIQALFSLGKDIDFSGIAGGFSSIFNSFELGNIKGVFEGVRKVVVGLKDAIVDFFTGSQKAVKKAPNETVKSVEEVGSSFEKILGIVKGVVRFFGAVGSAIAGFFSAIGNAIGSIGSGIGDALSSGNFDNVLKVLQTGLLGGLVVVVAKFLKNGFNFDLGGGLFKSVTGTFDQLTSTLKTMQTQVKADILMKIAAALAAITVSVIALSFVDGEKLAKALTVVVVGLTALVGVMASMNKIVADPSQAAKLAILAGTIILIAGATIVLAFAINMLDGVGWSDITAGMTGLTTLLVALVASTEELSKNTDGLIKGSIGLVIIAGAMVILAGALRIMSGMGWEETAVGITALGASLTILFATLGQMPPNTELIKMGIGLGILSVSLGLLAGVLMLYNQIDFFTMLDGITKMGTSMAILGASFGFFPKDAQFIKISSSMLLLAGAMVLMSGALFIMSKISWADLAKGLIGMAGAMKILASAVDSSKAKIGNGVALTLIALGIGKLVDVIEQLGKMSIGTILKGLLGLGIIFTALYAAVSLISPVVPVITALGTGLLFFGLAIGAAAAGFGIFLTGLANVIKALQGGAKGMSEALKVFSKAIPAIVSGIVVGIIEGFFSMKEVLFKAISDLFLMAVDFLIKAFPKIKRAIIEFVRMILDVVTTLAPDIIATGGFLFLSFLEGIRDNIGGMTRVVADIVINFLDAFADKIPEMTKSLVKFLITLFTNVAKGMGEVAGSLMFGIGINFIEGFWNGIKDQVSKLGELIWGLMQKVIDWFKDVFGISSPSKVMAELGGFLMDGLLGGILDGVVAIMNWFIGLASTVLGWIGDVANTLKNKGIDFIAGLLSGIWEKAIAVSTWFISLAGQVLGWIGNVTTSLKNKGIDFIVGLLSGLWEKILEVMNWFKALPGKIVGWIGDGLKVLLQVGKDIITGLWEGLKEIWNDVKDWVMDKVNWIKDTFADALDWGIGGIEDPFAEQRKMLSGTVGKDDKNMVNASSRMGERVGSAFTESLNGIIRMANGMDEFNPVIAPVLDLSNFRKEASTIAGYIPDADIEASFAQARIISIQDEDRRNQDTSEVSSGSTEIKYEQNNYSPKALSTNEIYRQTRGQIATLKEELKIA